MRPRSRQTAALRIIAGTFGLALAMAATAQSEPCDSSPAQAGCEPQWRWSAYAGALLLQPNRPASAAFVTSPTGSTPAAVVDASNFRPDGDTVPEIVLRTRFGNWGVEGRYIGNSSGSATGTVPGATTFRTAGIGVTILGGGDIVTNHATRLHSAELHATYRVYPGITALAGVRSIELRDRFRSDLSAPSTFVDWNNRNRLLGAQVGADFAFSSRASALQVDLIVKAGVYRNKARNGFTSTVVASTSDAASPTTLAAELGFGVSWAVTRQVVVRAGYAGLWLDKVALAGESAAATTQVPGGTSSLVRTGSLRYEGLSLGVEYRL